MSPIKKVAIFGASGNFGKPITAALLASGEFEVTVITRAESQASFPEGVSAVVRTTRGEDGSFYSNADELRHALEGQDAVVSALGPGAIAAQVGIVEAACAAGVRRFVLDDFGWGPDFQGLPELGGIKAQRQAPWDRAAELAEEQGPNFSWTAVAIGNPIDWALKRFPAMGFDVTKRIATIYDSGTERFTGTTLEGIGQSILGVLRRPEDTANRHVKVRSVETCQAELLTAFESAAAASGTLDATWDVRHENIADILERGRKRQAAGEPGWTLDLAVAQLFGLGQDRSVLVSGEASDGPLLGVREEPLQEIVSKVLAM